MAKYVLITFITFILVGCSLNKKKQFDDFLVKHNFTIFWYIDDFAKKGIDKYPVLKWKDCNESLNHFDITGIKHNRDIDDFLIVERYDSLYWLETTLGTKRIILKKGNKLYFYGPSSNNIKTNRVIDLEAQQKLYKALKNALDIEDSIVNGVTFKENLIKNYVIKPTDIFVITSPRKDSLEFYHTSENNSCIVRWYYERMDYFHSRQQLQDSTTIE
jgi:hypothetical protein